MSEPKDEMLIEEIHAEGIPPLTLRTERETEPKVAYERDPYRLVNGGGVLRIEIRFSESWIRVPATATSEQLRTWFVRAVESLAARIEELEHPQHRDVTIPVLHKENRRLVARIQSLLCQRHSTYQFEDEEGKPFCIACSCEDQEAGWQKAEAENERRREFVEAFLSWDLTWANGLDSEIAGMKEMASRCRTLPGQLSSEEGPSE